MESIDENILNFYEENRENKEMFNNNQINEAKIKKSYIIIISLLMLTILAFSLFFILGPMKEESYNNINDNGKLFMKIEEETCNKGENEKCLTCEGDHCGSCNIGYKLKEGKCIFTYSFKATYELSTSNKLFKLFNYDEKRTFKIVNIQFKGKNYNSIKTNYFPFPGAGRYEIYVLLDITESTSLYQMFYYLERLISISFSEDFNTKNITNMAEMFEYASNIVSVNISSFNTENVKYINGIFYGCHKLTSIGIFNFNTLNLVNMNSMFSNCELLRSINL